MSEDKAQDSSANPEASQDARLPAQATDNAGNNAGADKADKHDGRVSRLRIFLLAVLALVAIAISGYAFYLTWQLQADHSETATRQQSLTSNIAELQNELGRNSVALADIREIQAATRATLERLAERERMDNFDWAMAEVEYLTIIAMQRLNLARDVDTALAALEAAAQRVKDISNPGLLPVREQLTSDINALRAVPETDAAGMALYLGDLITRAEQLPLASDVAGRNRPVETPAADAPVEGWRGMLGAIWDELRQLIVIQREDAPPTELLAPDERYFLYQNLRVELASARTAALRHDTRNLRLSIDLIQDWLARYFNTDAEAVANIQESLTQMASVDLSPELPDISGSLESVRAWQRRQADEAGE